MTQNFSSNKIANDPSAYALRSAWLGGAIWLIALIWSHPSLFTPQWATAMLLLAPLVLVPLALRLVEPDGTWVVLRAVWRMAILLQAPAAILLVPAFLLSQSWIAAALALPWLITSMLIALTGVLRVWLQGFRSLEETAISAGLVYIAVGGGWLVLDRLGVQPLNFEPIIVLLTAIHFHYAGFLLPIFTGLAGRILKGGVAKLAAIGVIVGVPLVAAGITATQLGFNTSLETIAAWLTSLAGLLAAILHIRIAIKTFVVTPSGVNNNEVPVPKGTTTSVKALFALCSLALAFSMILSALYGARFYFSLAWLDLPWMRALHGSANALGFGLAGVLGWSLMRPQNTKRHS